MGMLKKSISKSLQLEIRNIGEDRLIDNMCRSFRLCKINPFQLCIVLSRLESMECARIFDDDTLTSFEDWFRKHRLFGKWDKLEDFRTLVTSSCDFMLLSHYLCQSPLFFDDTEDVDDDDDDDTISVISSDMVVFEMNKSAAITQSVVLGDLLESCKTAGHEEDEIPLHQVSSLVLQSIISFCEDKHKFTTFIESAVEPLKSTAEHVEHLKSTVDAYKASLTSFVKTKRPLFSHLHQAADYLDIPTLSEFISEAVGDMKEKSAEEISDWYARLSLPPMLSPLPMETYSKLSQAFLS